MSARLTPAELRRAWWNVNCCDGKFTGLMTAHCAACCETFTRPTVAEKHRRYGKCVDPATFRDRSGALVFKDAGRVYPCWSGAGDDATAAWVDGIRA